MDVDLLRPGMIPIAPNTKLWFEFLIEPSLLEEHLNKEHPGMNLKMFTVYLSFFIINVNHYYLLLLIHKLI